MRSIRLALPLLLLILGPILLAYAGDVAIKYEPDSVPGIYRSGISSDDPTEFGGTNLDTIPAIPTENRPTLTVSPRASWAGATYTVTCVKGKLAGGAFQPFGRVKYAVTADSTQKINGNYVANDIDFDTAGITHCKVLVATISSGTVTLGIMRH